ncbi:MAG: hypothetical protein JSS66_04790 [Armatimonadetes bacterium]|nr:hypothetical protein [Armatimonadota bacterium]
MQSELEVFAVMRCPACRDTFLVTQPIAMAHDYYDKLPKDQEEARKEGSPITIEEMRSFRNQLSNPKSLKTVIESEQNSDDNRS